MTAIQGKSFRSILGQSLKSAIKFPLLLLIIGLALTFAGSLHLFQSYRQWEKAITIANQVGNALVLLSCVMFTFLLTLSLCKSYIKEFTEKQSYLMANILSIIKNGLRIILALVTVNIILSAIELDRAYFDMAHNVIYVIIIAAVAWIALQILPMIEAALQRRYTSMSVTPDARRAISLYTRFHIIRNIATVFIVVLAIAASLMVFDKVRNLGISLLASAGFLTAVLALAAQKTLSSFFVGLQLVLTHPLEIGDMIVVENELGTVEEINLSYITVKIWDLRRMVLPISYFIDKPFQNWSKSLEGLLGTIFLYVDYTLPIEVLREELNKVIQETPLWDKKVCQLVITNFKENTVELRILVSSINPGKLFDLQCFLREKLLHFICKNYPHSLPKVRVNQFEATIDQR